MLLMDSINARFGRDTVKVAATGTTQQWQMQRSRLSPRYTTCWDELLRTLTYSSAFVQAYPV